MSALPANLRKAAILIRSLDGDTAAKLLGQLSPAEAKSLRLAIQSLGPIEHEEQAYVADEFRRVTPPPATNLPTVNRRDGVEMEISSDGSAYGSSQDNAVRASQKPFEFLDDARIESLVPYLAREQSQTIAVVLSYLAPDRAALVLAALPARQQVETMERLATQGETDPAALHVLERELASWLSRQQSTRSRPVRRTDTVAAILAAADESTRGSILTNLAKHNRHLAEEIAPPAQPAPQPPSKQLHETVAVRPAPVPTPPPAPTRQPAASTSRPRIKFDDLARVDQTTLAAILRTVETEVLVLALTGADEEIIDRIATQMPRSIAKAFRQRLNRVGPTRLRDVAAAQQDVVDVASKIIQARRSMPLALAG